MKRPRGTSAGFVYDRLREEILSLELEPGTMLDETELSRRLEISRSPVREALIRLSSEGLVRTLPNRSSIVAFFDVTEILGFFDALDLLYRATARLAAKNASAADLVAIQAAEQSHRDALDRSNSTELITLNQAFHGAIARAGGNPYFVGWTEQLLNSGQRILRLYMRHLGDSVSNDAAGEHAALVKAIVARDPEAAEEAARRDAAHTTTQMLAFLADRQLAGTGVETPGFHRETSLG